MFKNKLRKFKTNSGAKKIKNIDDNNEKKKDSVYKDNPKVSFIIQYYNSEHLNHRDNIIPIVNTFRNTYDGNEQIIVCNDSMSDLDIFSKVLNKPNDYIICSNNLHEIRSYNKAGKYANGEFLFFCQDDDIFCNYNKNWVKEIVNLFNEFPKLGIITLKHGFLSNWIDRRKEKEYYGSKRILSYQNRNSYYIGEQINYRDKKYGYRFQFVLWGNIGPFIVRKKFLEELGYFNLAYSNVGESGIGLDVEMCLRFFEHGYFTGIYHIGHIKRGVGGHGTLVTEEQTNLRKNAYERNIVQFLKKYPDKLVEQYLNNVFELNNKLLEKYNV